MPMALTFHSCTRKSVMSTNLIPSKVSFHPSTGQLEVMEVHFPQLHYFVFFSYSLRHLCLMDQTLEPSVLQMSEKAILATCLI